ncbi:transglutaminase family protein [uncultured Methylibium sp.]|uniref:transglutaminase-like domain-containing protein n=1 Tax=uncultured Methylibium sp. TaxID=381093 RepID=UPI0025CFBA6A|nr:transglutaminase family protein [uncultured Methylibium sp.]
MTAQFTAVTAPASPASVARDLPHECAFRVDCELVYEVTGPTDFVFLLHALDKGEQRVAGESIDFHTRTPFHVFADPTQGHRFTRVHVESGSLRLLYRALVRKRLPARDLHAPEHPIHELPDHVLHNLAPTRYCESDLLGRAAYKLFGELPPGHGRVQAIADWIHDNVEYAIGSTGPTTTAREVFVQRAGVCRDFAHLGVTFCRALNIPARLAVGYARFEEPPPDFHAMFEAWLGRRWVLFDPTRLTPADELIRIASGRDAKDVAFATLFGPGRMLSMNPRVEVVGSGSIGA